MRPVAPSFELDEDIPTSPGEMQWVPCPLHVRRACQVCEGTGRVLTMLPVKSERYCLVPS